MKYLNYSYDELKSKGGFHTAKEICSQPALWERTYLKLVEEKERLSEFIEKVKRTDSPNVVLTGAGTSAFIGEALVGVFQKKWKTSCRAISTTDIVTHPENYFIKSKPTLLISFARSGDSPESVAAVELAKQHCDELYELVVTSNEDGALSKNAVDENSCVFLLPEETNDRSLAMTSSFTCMLLAGLLILDIGEIEQRKATVKKIRSFGDHILNNYLKDLESIANIDFERMVFLGSGSLFGLAHESHLKVQELSDGKIICKFDSFLGFRHGPKAVINDKTVIAYLFSNNFHVRNYELDLLRNIKETGAGEKSIAVGICDDNKEFDFDLSIQFPSGINEIPEDYLSVFYILPAQIIGFYKSLSLGLTPDSPSKRGTISRVVQGVKIYKPLVSESL